MKTNFLKRISFLVLLIIGLICYSNESTLAGTQEKAQEAKQEKKEQPGSAIAGRTDLVTRIYKLRFSDPGLIANRIQTLFQELAVVTSEPQARILAVRAIPEVMSSIEDLIKQTDVPPPTKKNIELTIHLLLASDSQTLEGKLPDQLQPVVRQLKNTFAYSSYSLLDTIVTRVRDGDRAQMNGVFPFQPAVTDETRSRQPPATYQFVSRSIELSLDDKGTKIQLNGMSFSAGIPAAGVTLINTNVDLRDGQMAVVGKTSAGGSPNALIVVLTAKVLE